MNIEHFKRSLKEVGLNLSDDQLEGFSAFEEALYRANQVTNLTRVAVEDCWLRHFMDSLLFQDLLPQGSKVLDIGTGPGFPAWPLASARPDLSITALDSNAKMLGFLASMPLTNLRVVNGRAEEWSEKGKFDVVTGRAVAPLSAQLEISAPFCKVGGLVIPMRSSSDLEGLEGVKLDPLGLRLSGFSQRALPGSDVVRLFPIYEKFRTTQTGYPRRWSEIKRHPL